MPSTHLTTVSNVAVGGAVTLGVVGRTGDAVVAWLSFTKLASAVTTPFGDLWVPVDFQLPALAITGDDRVYAGVPIPQVQALVGRKLHAQAATIRGLTVRLARPDEIVLR